LAGVKETISTVKLVNDLSPDAVALVGDIGDQPVTDILHEKLAPLVTLEAPDGVYWSPGEMRVEESFFKEFFEESFLKRGCRKLVCVINPPHSLLSPPLPSPPLSYSYRRIVLSWIGR